MNQNIGESTMSWRKYKAKPPFDGRYLVRATSQSEPEEYTVKDGQVYDSDDDKALNFNCEWLRIGSS